MCVYMYMLIWGKYLGWVLCSLRPGRLGVALVTNRPLNALPLPGVSTGDWGRPGEEKWPPRHRPQPLFEKMAFFKHAFFFPVTLTLWGDFWM